MKRLLFIIIFITFLHSNEKSNITLQLNWLHQFQFAGYYIAKEKGFYKDVGLDVTINEFSNNIELNNILKNKEADFAIGRSSLLINKINGEDIVAIAAIFQNSPLMLLSIDEKITTIEDIRNKKIMITPDAEFTASLTAMLNSNGIYKENIQIIEHSFNIEDLINKKVDLMASYISNELIVLKDRGINYNIFHPKDYGFDFYSDILFTSSEFIKQNPITTKKFYEASLKGWEYAFNNKIEAAELIYKKYNSQNKSLINLIKEAEILETLAINEENNKIGALDKRKLEKILQVFKVLGLTKGQIDLNSFIYEHNHHKKLIFEIAPKQRDMIVMLIIFLTIIFIIIIFFLNKIHNKRKLLDAVINSTDDLIYYKDQNLNYLGCNKSFEKFAKKNKKEIIGKNDFELFDKKYASIFRENDLKVLNDKQTSTDNEWLEFDGKTLLFQSKKRALEYNSKTGIGILGISRDITNLYEIQKKLEEQATIDELTKTYNRKVFNEKISELIDLYKRYEIHFSIALFDIDNFKNINDTYGHNVGDEVLKNISLIIKNNIRVTDMLFRIGGEEFIIIYPKIEIDDAFVSIEKLKNLIKNEKMIPDSSITFSIGLTQITSEDNEDTIFKRVDDLMYFSKKNGKDKISVD